MLPDEDGAIARIKGDLAEELRDARRLLNVGIRAPLHAEGRGSHLKGRPRFISHLLLLDSCRHFRSIIVLAEIGNGMAVDILTRTLFESLLGMNFVLAPRLRLWTEDRKRGKVTRTPLNLHGRILTPQFRATLYCAYIAFQMDDWVWRIRKVRGLKRASKALQAAVDPKATNVWIDEIGVSWSERLLRSRSYSGLKIAGLARCVSKTMAKYYNTLYSYQSAAVHGVKISELINKDDDGPRSPLGTWQDDSTQLRRLLRTACGLFYSQIAFLHQSFDYGVAVETQLADFSGLEA